MIFLAGTQNLREAVATRLGERAPEARRRRAELHEVASTVWWKPTYSQFETAYAFHLLSRHLRPEDYRELCTFGPAWFARVDPAERLPRFVPTSAIGGEGGEVIGPFPDRRSCVKLIERLEDLFDLCRYNHILEQTPHGVPCAYLEMGRCPAPCDGRFPLESYRQCVRDALAMVTGKGPEFIAEWKQRMTAAAAGLRYEEAAGYKRRLEAGDSLLPKACRFVRHADQFRYLVVQRDAGRRRVRPFFATRQGIVRGQAVGMDQITKVAAEWIIRLHASPDGSEDAEWSLASEQAALVSHFLFKRERAPGLHLHASELGDAADLAARVRDSFERATRAGAAQGRE